LRAPARSSCSPARSHVKKVTIAQREVLRRKVEKVPEGE
jgi:hypothetical protein